MPDAANATSGPRPMDTATAFRAAIDGYRDVLRWVVGAFGAIGILVVGAAPIASVTGVAEAVDAERAAVGTGIALAGVSSIIFMAARALQPRLVDFHDIEAKSHRWAVRALVGFAELEDELTDSDKAEWILGYSSSEQRSPLARLRSAVDGSRKAGTRQVTALAAEAMATLTWRARYLLARNHFRQAIAAVPPGLLLIATGLSLVLTGLSNQLAADVAAAKAQPVLDVTGRYPGADTMELDDDQRLGPRAMVPTAKLVSTDDGFSLEVAGSVELLAPGESARLIVRATGGDGTTELASFDGQPDSAGGVTFAFSLPIPTHSFEAAELDLAAGALGEASTDRCQVTGPGGDSPFVRRCSMVDLRRNPSEPSVQASLKDGRVSGSASALSPDRSKVMSVQVRTISPDGSGRPLVAVAGQRRTGQAQLEFDVMVRSGTTLVIVEAELHDPSTQPTFGCEADSVRPGCLLLWTD